MPQPPPLLTAAPAVHECAWCQHSAYANMPRPPAGEVSSGVLTLNGNPYLVTVGEHPDREDDPNHGVTLVYDIRGQQFLTAGKRPEIGNHHASEVYQNRMYLLGGLSAGEAAVQIGELRAGAGGSGVEIVWTQGAALPVPSGSASSALIGGKVRALALCFTSRPARVRCVLLTRCRKRLAMLDACWPCAEWLAVSRAALCETEAHAVAVCRRIR